MNKVSASIGPALIPPSLSLSTATPSGNLTISSSSSATLAPMQIAPEYQSQASLINVNGVMMLVPTKAPACEAYGDLNLDGKVTADDMKMYSDYIANKLIASNSTAEGGYQYISTVGDVNGDTKVDATDIQIVQQYIDIVDSTFPVCQKAKISPCDGIGDVTGDGKVTPFDAYETLFYNVGFSKASLYTRQPLTAEQLRRADVNGDGRLMSVDPLQILRYFSGFNYTFKACTPVTPKPNLGIEDISLTNPYAFKTVGDTIDLDIVIKNYGNTIASSSSPSSNPLTTKVQVHKPNATSYVTICSPQIIAQIEAGGSITQKIRGCGTYELAGDYSINVIIDADNIVDESNEQDNTIVTGAIVKSAAVLSSPTPTPTPTPTSQPTPTPSSSPNPVVSPSSTPAPSPIASPVPSIITNGAVSLIPSPTSAPTPTINSNVVLAVNNSPYTYSGNEGVVSLVTSSLIPSITSAQNSTLNILTTGLNFILEGLRWSFGIIWNNVNL